MAETKKKRFKKVYIEITNVCNLKCSFCPPSKRAAGFMELSLIQGVFEQVKAYTDIVTFHIKGEPLIHPQLGVFLEHAQLSGLKVNLTSNGTLIHKVGEVLLQQDALRQVNFSLHSLEEDSTEATKLAYLEPILAFSKEASKKGIFISLRLWNGDVSSNQWLFSYLENTFNLPNTLSQAIIMGKGIKLAERIYLNQDEVFEWPSLSAPCYGVTGTCHGLRNQLGILVDGTVVPCCLDNEGDIPLGNIKDESLQDLLNKPRVLQIVKGFEEQRLVEDLCQRCGYRQRFGKELG